MICAVFYLFTPKASCCGILCKKCQKVDFAFSAQFVISPRCNAEIRMSKDISGFFLFYPHNTKPDNTDEEKQVRLYLEIYPILAKSCCIQQNNMVDIIKFKI